MRLIGAKIRGFAGLGRLTKLKIDEIKKLYGEGWTKKEVAQKVGVSRSTVLKYVGREQERLETPHPPPLEVLCKAFFSLLTALAISPYLGENAVEEWSGDQALNLLRNLATSNKELVRRLISNDYVQYLREQGTLNLNIPANELDEVGRRQREKWLQLMKEICPEALGEFIT